MEWKTYYASHCMSAEEAVRMVDAGSRIVTGSAAAQPDLLLQALALRAKQENVAPLHISNMMPLSGACYVSPEFRQYFTYRSIFASRLTRTYLTTGQAAFVPCHFHAQPGLWGTDEDWGVDVAMVLVSQPNENGEVSLGISVDYALAACRKAKIIIAEVDSNMPDTPGNTHLPVTDIAGFVPTDRPLNELQPPIIGPVETEIGRNIASFIHDGDCLQLGIGAIPDAVLQFLADKNDLGIHSEMISDGVMRLVRQGAITGKKKSLHPGKIVFTFAMGSPSFYNWLHRNPCIAMYPVDYTNDPAVIALNDNLVSINSAISIDLMGQVAADMVGTKIFSGIGGQGDFVRGATMSKGGKSFIAMPSTAAHGTVSRICAALMPGQAVTTPCTDVDYVVTEYGAVRLYGRSLEERSELLIGLAAPQFRRTLREQRREIYGW